MDRCSIAVVAIAISAGCTTSEPPRRVDERVPDVASEPNASESNPSATPQPPRRAAFVSLDPLSAVHHAYLIDDRLTAQRRLEEGRAAARAHGDRVLELRYDCLEIRLRASSREEVGLRDRAIAIVEALEAVGAPDWARAECLDTASIAAFTEELDDAEALSKRAVELDAAAPHPDPERRAAIWVNYAGYSLAPDDGEEVAVGGMTFAVGQMETALDLEIESGIPACPEQAATRIRLAFALANTNAEALTSRAVEQLEQAHADCVAAELPAWVARVDLERSHHALRAGDHERALNLARGAQPVIADLGQITPRIRIAFTESAAWSGLGRHDEARAPLSSLLATLDGAHADHPARVRARYGVVVQLSSIDRDAGELDAAWKRLDDLDLDRPNLEPRLIEHVRLLKCELARAHARDDVAAWCD